jgi:hypothetical protein
VWSPRVSSAHVLGGTSSRMSHVLGFESCSGKSLRLRLGICAGMACYLKPCQLLFIAATTFGALV